MTRRMLMLTRFLECPHGQESEQLLERLIRDEAAPIVERVVSFKIRGGPGEDVRGDVLADLDCAAAGVKGFRRWRDHSGLSRVLLRSLRITVATSTIGDVFHSGIAWRIDFDICWARIRG